MFRSFKTLTLLAAFSALPLKAQTQRRPILQFALGAGSSTGGDFEEREEYVAELTLAWAIRGSAAGGPLAGVVVGKTFVNGSDLTCRLRADMSCVPIMTRFGYASAIVGFERIGSWGTASIAAGPALALGESSSLHAGALYRADYSTPAVQRLSLVVSGRGIAVSNVSGATVVLRSATLGVRLR